MQDWSQPSPGRAPEDEADRDPAQTAPDPADDPAEWDELTPASTGPISVMPPNDVLVAGTPLATPAEPPPPYESAGAARDVPADTSRAITDEPAGAPDESPGRAGQPSGRAGEPSGAAIDTAIIDTAIIDTVSAEGFQTRWHDVQFGFVDDPQDAIQRAGELATDVLTAFTDAINSRKSELDDWRGPGGQPDTERLRLAVRAYREFIDRLLDT